MIDMNIWEQCFQGGKKSNEINSLEATHLYQYWHFDRAPNAPSEQNQVLRRAVCSATLKALPIAGLCADLIVIGITWLEGLSETMRCFMRFPILIFCVTIAVIMSAHAQPSGPKTDSVTQCFRAYFPLALGMPMSAVPPEVRFYCAAPWNLQAFESVRKALDNSRYDVAGSAARMTSGLNAKVVLQTLPMAISAADSGPPGMGAVYLTYHILPLAYALHKQNSDAAIVEKAMDKHDVEKLRAAAAAIDWKLVVVANVKDFPSTAPVSPNATLGDLSMGILKHAQSKISK